MPICRIIVATVMLLSAAVNTPARAQATDVRFVLDFLLQGQSVVSQNPPVIRTPVAVG